MHRCNSATMKYFFFFNDAGAFWRKAAYDNLTGTVKLTFGIMTRVLGTLAGVLRGQDRSQR
jgi:hypothetical protein